MRENKSPEGTGPVGTSTTTKKIVSQVLRNYNAIFATLDRIDRLISGGAV